MPVFFLDEIQKDHVVHKKAEKVLGPEIEKLNHESRNLIKPLVLGCATLVSLSRIRKARNRVPRTNHNIGPKDVGVLNHATTQIRSERFSRPFIVVNRTKDGKNGEENVFVHKASRQDSLVRVITGVVQLWQNFEGKVRRRSLQDTYLIDQESKI